MNSLNYNKYEAVIFDLDGTLVDSVNDIADSMNCVLAAEGLPGYTYEQYKYLVGNGIKRLVEDCIPLGLRTDELVNKCFERMMLEYASNSVNKTRLYDGISEMLTGLESKGVKMSVLSNKADDISQKICSQLLCDRHFEIIMGASERFPRKPAPDSALYIAEVMNAAPDKIFYLGDTSVDMRTACAAGFFAAGALWGFRSAEELLAHGAQALIETPAECLKFFT